MRVGSIPETVGYTLARVCRAHRNGIGGLLSRLGLHVGQDMVLGELFREDGLRVGELACRLGVEPPTVTKMTTHLENSGFIERRRDKDDARCFKVFLTDAGRSLETPLAEIQAENEKKLLAGLGDEERKELTRLLAQVRRNLEGGSGEES